MQPLDVAAVASIVSDKNRPGLATVALQDTAMVTIMTPSAAKQRAAGTCPAPPDTPFGEKLLGHTGHSDP